MAIEERCVELSHGKSYYLEDGAGEPVILLHGVGFTSGGDHWRHNLPELSRRLRVLAPDLVGWGLGDRLEASYSFAYLVDFVREFQDALGLRRTHVVGHSMGGWVASLLAYESPDRVDRLVLVASGGLATRRLPSMQNFRPPDRDGVRETLRRQFGLEGDELERAVERDWEKVRLPGAVAAYERILHHMNDPLTRRRYQTTRRLPYISAPTLVVWGTRDQSNDASLGRETARLIPGARYLELDCGHFVPQEQPQAFNAAVAAFLCDDPAS